MNMIMESRDGHGTQSIPSFILGLLGVGECSVPPPASKIVKVLSDNYLSRAASVGFRNKSGEYYTSKQQSEDPQCLRMRESLKRGRVFSDFRGNDEELSTSFGTEEKRDNNLKLLREKNAKKSLPCSYHHPKHLKFHMSLCGCDCAVLKNRRSISFVRKPSTLNLRFCKETPLKEGVSSRFDKSLVMSQMGTESNADNQAWFSISSVTEDPYASSLKEDDDAFSDDSCVGFNCERGDNQTLTVKEENTANVIEDEKRIDLWVLLDSKAEGDWDSYAISCNVFEFFKKKKSNYCSRLLFDRINTLVKEMMDTCMVMGIPQWKKSVVERLGYGNEETLEDEIWKMLESQEVEMSKDSEKVLGKDDGWMRLVDEIQFIEKEIESYLIHELLQDFICC